MGVQMVDSFLARCILVVVQKILSEKCTPQIRHHRRNSIHQHLSGDRKTAHRWEEFQRLVVDHSDDSNLDVDVEVWSFDEHSIDSRWDVMGLRLLEEAGMGLWLW